MTSSCCGESSLEEKVKDPEFVRKLTEKVYALWLKDLQIEKERRHTFMSKRRWSMQR